MEIGKTDSTINKAAFQYRLKRRLFFAGKKVEEVIGKGKDVTIAKSPVCFRQDQTGQDS